MLSKLCWMVGMNWKLQTGRLGRLRLAEADEVWTRTEALPTWDVGACGLMLHTRAVGVTYMSLAPVSAMDVSEMGMLGGVGLQLGREVKVLERREELSLLSLDFIKLGFKSDPHRQAKLSQPLFLVAPGPAGLAQVAVSTWPGALFLQVPLVWRCPTPHLWEEQNLPMDQQFMIAAWRSLMVLWSGAASLVPGDLVPG